MRKFYRLVLLCVISVLSVIAFSKPVTAQSCIPGAAQTFTNNTPVNIVDNTTVTSTITVSGVPSYLWDVDIITNITHTFNADLDITITSPAGTVVTLTTDNGGSNDNVFAGTTWNDQANPGGQVPYTNNDGLCTDHLYVNNVVATPLAPEEPLAAFIGENPNGVWTLRIHDDLAGDVGVLNSWSVVVRGLSTTPVINLFTFNNNTAVPINDLSTAVSTITVSGAGTQIIDVNLIANITHTWNADLDITITSPAGTVVTITTDNGGSNDNVFAGTTWDDQANPGGQVPYTTNNGVTTDHSYTNNVVATPLTPEEALGAFVGENPNGVWTLRIYDDLSGDVGTLTSWGLQIRTANCATGCSGVPSPGSISPSTSNVCTGTPVTLTLSGYTVASGITFQWKESATPGGPYTNISGATSPTYTYNATATRYFVCDVTCTNAGGGTATTAQAVVNVSNPQHSSITATPSTTCSPGVTVISATATGGIGTYTHTLSGPGSISSPVVSGTNNANVSFTVTGIPAGTNTYTLTTTDGIGCTRTSNVTVTVNTTPVISLTTNPAPSSTTCTENFDAVTAPNLPSGWTASSGISCAASTRWATSVVQANSAPNSAFTNNPNCVSDEYLVSPVYSISAASQLTFRRNHQLETSFDGMVLEISINGGPFTDIISAGGSFVTGGYTHTISSCCGNPLSGRQAWSGNSGGWAITTVNLPAAAIGQSVVFRWRRGTDNSVSSVGVYIDDISVTNAGCANLTICNGNTVRIDASSLLLRTLANNTTINIPAPPATSGNAGPYPSVISVSGLPTTGVSVQSVTLSNYAHTWPDDVDVVLVSPTGQAVILMSDCGGSTPATGQTFTFTDAATTNLADNSFNPSGTYKPTNYGTGDNWPAPGPGTSPSSTTLSTFTGNPNGNWSLFIVDDLAGDVGSLGGWSITFSTPEPVVFSPATNLFTDAAATTPYTGTPAFTVWARPNTTTTYVATATSGGCTGSSSFTITVNQLPAITTQPTAMTAPVCPGTNVSFSVTATGTGLTYQWQRSTDNGATWSNITDGTAHSGTNTPTVTVLSPTAAQNGHRYRVIVSGVCPPSVTSNAVTLLVATPPTITTQPANRTVCAPDAATFTVVAAGSPAPTIYQWQVSTDGGTTWTNLTTGGSFTPTLTVSPTAASMNNNRYRVIVTNPCGQSVTSAAAILNVNTPTPVTISPLPSRICISDTLVPLNATPAGGSWNGIGVSGFNFIPPVTAVGTYTLTYNYVNAAGCPSSASVTARVEDCPERIRELDENAVILFPNPNNGRFNIRINSVLYNFLGMNVFNDRGQLLHNQVFSGLVYGRVIPINLNHLPSGIYMVKFFYDDGIRTNEKTFRVIIQR
ncbi:MAG: proprotein convertase P-domain-containing protein [Chitinophagaceae bacterium]|nr:proprotein convertase P-domain-containing protein [Chitinophagaceae bacterium]